MEVGRTVRDVLKRCKHANTSKMYFQEFQSLAPNLIGAKVQKELILQIDDVTFFRWK